MDLVLKITDKCNFACEFCSSNQIALTHNDLDINLVKKFLLDNPVQDIIVNGGDPLMVPPSYYEELLKFIDDNNLGCTMSFTTNLWDFYKHPDKWTSLFQRIGVCTSFQYGKARKTAGGIVFTEDIFRDVYSLFLERVNKPLNFISVITEENEDTVIKTVELAKELGTHCRINGALRSGRTTQPYPFWKMMKHYCDIMDAGLGDYEDNCKIIKSIISTNSIDAPCPFNRKCHSFIRCMSPGGELHTCPAIADDVHERGVSSCYTKSITNEFMDMNISTIIPREDSTVTPDCYVCELFGLCCTCTKRIKDIHDSKSTIEHCTHMKELKDRIITTFKQEN